MPESILERCASWCDTQAKSDWYGRSAGDMVRAFAANFGTAAQTTASLMGEERDAIECGWLSPPPKAAEQAPVADAARGDLSMLLKRFIRAARNRVPANAIADQAAVYLARNGLNGSPLHLDDEGTAVEFYLLNPSAALLDFRARLESRTAPTQQPARASEAGETAPSTSSENRSQAYCDGRNAYGDGLLAPNHYPSTDMSDEEKIDFAQGRQDAEDEHHDAYLNAIAGAPAQHAVTLTDDALRCDYCGAETPDPWHTSDTARRHLHQCDACHASAQAAAHAACDQAPIGWCCTREKGHAGPCAAHRASDVDELRQSIGETLSAKLYELMDKGKLAFDAYDAYNIDILLDDVMPLIDAERKGNLSPITGNQAPKAGEPKIEPPKRAVQFRVDIQADSEDALARTLGDLAARVVCRDLSRHSVSGAYDAGYEHSLTVFDRPTHDEYVEQMNAYLAARRDA